ncbi:MAG: tetratricopeptide repeat protein [Flavobacteriales bacterium]
MLLFLVGLVSQLYANKVEELRAKLKDCKQSDTNYIIALFSIAQHYESVASDSAVFYGELVIKKSKEINYPKGISLGYSIIGGFYNAKGEYQKSLDYTIQAYKLAEETKDSYGMSNHMNSLGNAYLGLEMIDKALESYKESYRIASENEINYLIGISSIGIGNIYLQKNDPFQALECFKQVNKSFEKLNNTVLTTISFTLLGDAYLAMEEYNLAMSYLLKAIDGYNEEEQGYELASTYSLMGELKLKQNRAYEAISYFQKALLIFQKRKALDNIKHVYQQISEAYLSLSSYKEALHFHKLYVAYKDSVFNTENSKEVLEIEAKYENEKKEKELELKELKLSEQDLKIQAQNTRSNFLIAGIIIFLVMMLIMFKAYRDKKKSNKNLEVKSAIIEQKNKEITDSINYAKRIQAAILPSHSTLKKYLNDFFVLYKPKDIVAGDFYWLESYVPPSVGASGFDRIRDNFEVEQKETEQNMILIAAADCTGHGVPGAMVSVVCNNGLNRSVREHKITDPGKILDKTREIVIQEFDKSDEVVNDGMDISLCALQGNTLWWAGANNPLWITRKGAAEVEEIKSDKQAIGKGDNLKPFTTHKIELQKGDSVYIFTDGYTDQFGGEKGKKFKASRLKELLLSISHEPMEKQKHLLNQAFEQWKGDLEQIDDVCIIGVRL